MLPLLVFPALLGSVVATNPYAVPKAEWDTLNSTVGGRLGRGVPFARACFKNVGANVTSGGADCASVQSNYGVAGKAHAFFFFAGKILTRWRRF